MKKFLASGLALVLLALVFAACSNGTTDSEDNAQQLSATPENFDEVIMSVREQPGNYVINLTGDLLDYHGRGFYTAGVNITVKGTGSNKITWKYLEDYPPLFYVVDGKLSLENINISHSPSNTQDWGLINVNGGTFEIKNGVTISGTVGNKVYDGIWIEDGNFIMSGGIIEKFRTGLATQTDGASITISGGIIRNNEQWGIGLWDDSKNCTLTMTGGEISSNGDGGIAINGTNNTFLMSGGIIEKCRNAVGSHADGASITISGGIIRNNTDNGIGSWDGKNYTLTMTGGEISGNGDSGVSLSIANAVFTMSGGSIGGNGFGVVVNGTNSGFEKRTGAVIYGKEAEKANTDGAIQIGRGGASKYLGRDAASDTVYAARTNAAGDVIEDSIQGEWD